MHRHVCDCPPDGRDPACSTHSWQQARPWQALVPAVSSRNYAGPVYPDPGAPPTEFLPVFNVIR